MYVVRRAFRNYGEMMAPGSFVEPGDIKRFKSRLNDGHIVEVPQQDFEKWQKYFAERMGVQLVLPEQTEETAQQTEETAQQTEETAQQTEETAQQTEEPAQQVQVAKVVVKVN